MMDDIQFLERYTDATRIVFSSLTHDLVAIKDVELKFLTMTHKMLHFLGFNSAEQVVGKKLEEFETKIDKDAFEKYNKQDLSIIKNLKNRVFLEVAPAYKGQAKIYKVYKTPVINPDTNNCVGIRIQITNMFWPNVTKALFKIHGTKGLLLTSSANKMGTWKDYSLTEIQHTVLFLCIHNYSYSEIAVLMNAFGTEITAVRVNDYLEQLKLIFHVRTKSQLIEKALGLNFHTYLPVGLFSHFSSIDITSDEAAILPH